MDDVDAIGGAGVDEGNVGVDGLVSDKRSSSSLSNASLGVVEEGCGVVLFFECDLA